MRRSKDNKILLTVTNEEIRNGTFIIPEGITTIGEGAFHYCTSLWWIDLPAGITTIAKKAFYHCTSLWWIDLPEGITTIGEGAFHLCTSLRWVDLPAGITTIARRAFYDCTSLWRIDLPAGITTIGEDAFCYCTSLTRTDLPAGITTIGEGAFSGCTSLREIVLPEGITTIGEGTFSGCISLREIELPEGITTMGAQAFHYCFSLKQIILPASLIVIGENAFACCYALEQIIFPIGLTKIGSTAFLYCTALRQTLLPECLTTIDKETFSGSFSLKKVYLHTGITAIDSTSFSNCTNLQILIINTDNNYQVERIKNLLPVEHRHKVIINPVYNKVIEYQSALYKKFLPADPMLGEHKFFYVLLMKHTLDISNKSFDLPFELVLNIASFDKKIYQAFKQVLSVLDFPITEQDLQRYKIDSKAIFKQRGSGEDNLWGVIQSADTLLAQEKIRLMLCAAKLKNYISYIEKHKAKKQPATSSFFWEDKKLALEIESKLSIAKKIIYFLGKEERVKFSRKEISLIHKPVKDKKNSFIKDCLEKYGITLPVEGVCYSMCTVS